VISAIEVPYSGSCAFCAYLQGERPYTVLQAGPLVATLVTREQRGIPHLLVIPTRHVPTILGVTDVEGSALMIAIRRAATAIDAAYQRPGIVVWQNNGVPANQSISHVHFHVAGTVDEGGTRWGAVAELSVDETDAIGERIAPHLGDGGK
jgi:histidine triad (HIT) family protein